MCATNVCKICACERFDVIDIEVHILGAKLQDKLSCRACRVLSPILTSQPQCKACLCMMILRLTCREAPNSEQFGTESQT